MDYSDVIRYFLDPANGYSKEELYEAYLDVTVRFLEELISAGTYESQIIACFGEEGGSEIIEKVAGQTLTLTFDYLQMNDVMKVLKDMDITPVNQQFDLRCTLTARVRLSRIEDFRKQLAFCQIN